MQNHHPALSFCLRDYSRKSGLCTFGARECPGLSRVLSACSFVFHERLIVLLLRQTLRSFSTCEVVTIINYHEEINNMIL